MGQLIIQYHIEFQVVIETGWCHLESLFWWAVVGTLVLYLSTWDYWHNNLFVLRTYRRDQYLDFAHWWNALREQISSLLLKFYSLCGTLKWPLLLIWTLWSDHFNSLIIPLGKWWYFPIIFSTVNFYCDRMNCWLFNT